MEKNLAGSSPSRRVFLAKALCVWPQRRAGALPGSVPPRGLAVGGLAETAGQRDPHPASTLPRTDSTTKLIRIRMLMQGDSYCNHRWVVEA